MSSRKLFLGTELCLLFELTRNDFEPTSEKATVESSPEEIVKLFESAKGHWLEGVLL